MPDKNNTYEVKANGFTFTFSDDDLARVDFVKTSPTEFNVITGNRSVNARIIESDTSGKKLKIEIAGESYDIGIRDELELMLEKMGYGSASGKQIKEIKAPMPGLVLEISVANGQEVNEGDKILILEAMKMENSIMIHAPARIKNIAVTAGQAVEKGQVLVELE